MALLDDLQAEVKKKRAEEFEQKAELEAQEAFYSVHLRPVMLRATTYFSEIVDNLNTVAPDIHPGYPLNPLLKEEVVLKQANYVFRSDGGERPRRIDIFCSCTLDQPLEFHLPGKDAVRRHVDLLDSYRFPHHCKNKLDKQYDVLSATFILEGPLQVRISILAHAADRCVYIELQNIEDQPSKRYKFSPEKIDDELLDRLARLLVREESKLVEVQVRDDVRVELRRQLDLEKRRQAEDLADAYACRQAELLAEENAKLINRAKRAVTRIAGGALKIFSKN